MPSKRTAVRFFQAALEGHAKGRVYLVLPFDPEKEWGARDRYHISGAINGHPVRGALEPFARDTFWPWDPRGAGTAAFNPAIP